MQKLVTIITPCYNAAEYLQRYFDSILKQNYRPLEIILVDDGSSDDTKQMIEAFQSENKDPELSICCLSQTNQGQAAALNRALKHVTGDFLLLLDCDDFLYPDCIQQRVAYLNDHPSMGFVAQNGEIYTEDALKPIRPVFEKYKTKNLFAQMIKGNYICNLAYLFRMDSLRSVLPNLEISTLRAGQNFQILLPMALFFECGYLPNTSFGRVMRLQSHSNTAVKTDFGQRLERCSQIAEITYRSVSYPEAAEWGPWIFLQDLYTKCLTCIQCGDRDKTKLYSKKLNRAVWKVIRYGIRYSLTIKKARLLTRKPKEK
ncbi:MAG: glycosyltransferase family 2 protein [Lachnospiraceae bacterium]|nr:glycosyltransferase family 2 protein [Lachnospiraceae bacterium]